MFQPVNLSSRYSMRLGVTQHWKTRCLSCVYRSQERIDTNMGHVCNGIRSPPGLTHWSAKTLDNCCNKVRSLARTVETSINLDIVLALTLPQKQDRWQTCP